MLFFCFTYSFSLFFNLLSLLKYSKKGIVNHLFLIGPKKTSITSLIFKTEFYIRALKFIKWGHELRTPMNAIIGYSEILTEDATDNQHQEYIPDLKKINSAGKHLLQLINDILDISKIEAGKMELDIHEINFASLAQEVADTSEALVTKNGNTLKIIKDETIQSITGDSVKIKQILFNLISNAAKFTENGTIKLGYKTHQDDNNFLSIYVQDTGIGIEKDKVAKVFE